jgi:AAA+ ATPase superfamily predicted ATPase
MNPSAAFIGRETQLALLSQDLADVAVTGRGRFVLIRGRRRVGKSRLVEEFLRQEQPASVFFAASRQAPERELSLFTEAISNSDVPAADVLRGGGDVGSWEGALNLIAGTAAGRPVVVVLDELPYLLDDDPSIEGTLQKVWDRTLADAPVLLIVVGSDISVMEMLTEYGRPLYGRPTRIIEVPPFSPVEIGNLLHLDAVDALEAYLVVGGFPLIAGSWPSTQDLREFLRDALADPTSPLIVSGERILAAEFPEAAQAKQVLTAIGSGERAFTGISRASGVRQSSLQRALKLLVEDKQVVASATPLSTRVSRERRYWVGDPYLRFWLRFILPAMEEIERGRGHAVVDRLLGQWPDYRGKAIEPVVRDSISRRPPDPRLEAAGAVGGYWTRTNDVEIDIVVADRSPRAGAVLGAGFIKWRSTKTFQARDRDDLARSAQRVPGAGSPLLIGVSRNGFSKTSLDVMLTPPDVLEAWAA